MKLDRNVSRLQHEAQPHRCSVRQPRHPTTSFRIRQQSRPVPTNAHANATRGPCFDSIPTRASPSGPPSSSIQLVRVVTSTAAPGIPKPRPTSANNRFSTSPGRAGSQAWSAGRQFQHPRKCDHPWLDKKHSQNGKNLFCPYHGWIHRYAPAGCIDQNPSSRVSRIFFGDQRGQLKEPYSSGQYSKHQFQLTLPACIIK